MGTEYEQGLAFVSFFFRNSIKYVTISSSIAPNFTNATLRMCHRVDDVMKLCCELSAHHQIRTTVKGSSKGAAAAGWLAFAGGIVGGPLGIAVGQWKI